MVLLIDFYIIVQSTYFHALGKCVGYLLKQQFLLYLLLSHTAFQSGTKKKLLCQITQQIKLNNAFNFYLKVFFLGQGLVDILLLKYYKM